MAVQRIQGLRRIGAWATTVPHELARQLREFEDTIFSTLLNSQKLRILDGTCSPETVHPTRDWLRFLGDCYTTIDPQREKASAVNVHVGQYWEQGPLPQAQDTYGSFTFEWDLPALWKCFPPSCVVHLTVTMCQGVLEQEANPTPRSVGVSAHASDTSSPLTLAPTPALLDGDIVLARVMWTTGAGESSAGTCTAPSGEGWSTAVAKQETNVGGGAYIATQTFWKRWGSGSTDEVQPQFSVSGVTLTNIFGVQESWRDCVEAGSPIDASAASSGTSITAVCPDATATGDGRAAVRFEFGNQASAFSEGTALYSGATYPFEGASFTDQEAAGAVGTANISLTGSTQWLANTILLIPADPVVHIEDDYALQGTMYATYNGGVLIVATELTGGVEFTVATSGGVIQTVFAFTSNLSNQRYATARLRIDNVMEREALQI